MKRLVIRVPNPLGDMIMATAALDAIREKWPDAHIAGHGIGLAIVKEIAESYGGQLEISRSELGGAKFCVRIPSS